MINAYCLAPGLGPVSAFVHLLRRDDVPLIHDFMLTKATLLMTQNATSDEWLFEITSMAARSGACWERNSFFLGYAVARLIAAQQSQGIYSAPEHEPATSALSTFMAEFTQSVSDDDVHEARRIWTQSMAEHSELTTSTLLINLVNGAQTRPVGQSWGAIAEELHAPRAKFVRAKGNTAGTVIISPHNISSMRPTNRALVTAGA